MTEHLTKAEQIMNELKADDCKLLNRYLKGEVPTSYFTEKYGISRQYVYDILNDIDANFMDVKKEVSSTYVKTIISLAKEGVPLKEIMKNTQFYDLFQVKMNDYDTRAGIIRRAKTLNLIESPSDLKFIMVESKVKAYITTLQIAEELERYMQERHMRLDAIGEKYGASYQKVYGIKEKMELVGHPLPKLPQPLVDVIKRNITITKKYRSGQSSIRELAGEYRLTETVVQMIINGYMPYVVL